MQARALHTQAITQTLKPDEGQIHERVENAKLQALHEVKINEIYRSVYIPGGIVCGPCYICKLHHIDLEFIKVRVYNFKCIEKN